jgi:hypothetical protein
MNIQMRLNVKIIYDHACDNEKDNLEYSLTFSNVY